jgi:hypothetical protein
MHAGQKVMLVDDAWPEGIHDLYDQLPLKDIPYVIRSVHLGTNLDALRMDLRREDCLALLLVGVNNPISSHKFGAVERGFAARRFRLLEELKQETAQMLEQVAPDFGQD